MDNSLNEEYAELEDEVGWVFDKLDETESQKLLNVLNSEKGKGALMAGIRGAVFNSERLLKDAQNTSEPTKSALLELAMEEAEKSYYLCVIYLYIFDIDKDKLPIFVDEEQLRRIKEMKLTTPMNIFNAIFKYHKIKEVMSFVGRYAAVKNPDAFKRIAKENAFRLGKRGRELEAYMQKAEAFLKEVEAYKKIDFDKIKMDGIYVNIDVNSLEVLTPKPANSDEIKEMEYMLKISLANSKDFLRKLGVTGI
jgi:hypothetical protein